MSPLLLSPLLQLSRPKRCAAIPHFQPLTLSVITHPSLPHRVALSAVGDLVVPRNATLTSETLIGYSSTLRLRGTVEPGAELFARRFFPCHRPRERPRLV